jgi:hypothetical protein
VRGLGLEAHDRALGMGISGPALRTLFEAAHGERAPATGFARFQVTVLKSGAVEVSLRDATGELASWHAVAEDAASRLRAFRFQLRLRHRPSRRCENLRFQGADTFQPRTNNGRDERQAQA